MGCPDSIQFRSQFDLLSGCVIGPGPVGLGIPDKEIDREVIEHICVLDLLIGRLQGGASVGHCLSVAVIHDVSAVIIATAVLHHHCDRDSGDNQDDNRCDRSYYCYLLLHSKPPLFQIRISLRRI